MSPRGRPRKFLREPDSPDSSNFQSTDVDMDVNYEEEKEEPIVESKEEDFRYKTTDLGIVRKLLDKGLIVEEILSATEERPKLYIFREPKVTIEEVLKNG